MQVCTFRRTWRKSADKVRGEGVTRDEKNVLHNQTIDRLFKNGVDVTNTVDVVVALQNEIDSYREKINALGDQNAEQAQAIENMRFRISKLEEANEKKHIKLAVIKNRNEQLETALNNRDEQIDELEAAQKSTTAEIIKALAENGYNNISVNFYKTEREE